MSSTDLFLPSVAALAILPLSLLMISFVLYLLVARRHSGASLNHLLCYRCGYDLSGSEGERCSECGHATSRLSTSLATDGRWHLRVVLMYGPLPGLLLFLFLVAALTMGQFGFAADLFWSSDWPWYAYSAVGTCAIFVHSLCVFLAAISRSRWHKDARALLCLPATLICDWAGLSNLLFVSSTHMV